ncbi:hypothetical protein [Anabaena sp. PCC 7108]|uniref:hypothetical protein n=1 Tax=Anabaena sp. PCC 7108 TaxID=163908 RepID=UPI00034D5259|nr:hypothetical protein [Anabaena sp. PCC 7108]
MAKIVISSSGTLGDHLPYVALGEYLQAQGHHVCMAINEAMHPYGLKAGLEVINCGHYLGQKEAKQAAKDWEHLNLYSQSDQDKSSRTVDFFKQQVPLIFTSLLSVCRDADLLICSIQMRLFGAMIEEKIGLSWIVASVTPSFQCIKKTEQLINNEPDPLLPTFNQIRKTLGLNELRADCVKDYQQSKRAILASSPHFSQLNSTHDYDADKFALSNQR